MPQTTDIPNFSKTADAPQLEGPGIAAALERKIYKPDEPIIVHGKYGSDADLNKRAEGNPLTRIVLRVARTDDPDSTARPVKDAHVVPPATQGDSGEGEGYIVYGYFNVDLRKYSRRIKDPGKYWMQAEFFEHKTPRIEFEIK